MARKGLIYSFHSDDGPPEYTATQYVIGFFDFQVGRLEQDLAEQAQAYWRTVPARFWKQVPQLGTIPVGESIPTTSDVMIYE